MTTATIENAAAAVQTRVLPFLHSPRMRLRLLEKTDTEALRPYFSDDAVTRYLRTDSWHSVEEGHEWSGEACASNATGATAWFVCIEDATDRIVGTCVLFNFDPVSRRVELGYMIGREHWQRGFAFEAASTLINHAFGAVGLTRIEAIVDVAHLASQHLALKLGFTREGLLRKYQLDNKGVPCDVVIFSMLVDDPRPSP